MKKYILLAILLAAGMTASPQATRRARQSKSKSSQVSRSSTKRSGSAVRYSSRSSSQKTKPKSVTQVRRSNQHAATKKHTVRSTRSSIPSGVRGRTSSRNSDQMNRSQSVNRSSIAHSTRTVGRGRATTQPVARSARTVGRRRTTTTKPIAHRVVTERKNTLVLGNGREIRHQNNEVFKHQRYRLDYRNVSDLRKSPTFINVYNEYNVWRSHRVMRVVNRNYYYRPISIDIRRMRYPYRIPVYIDLVWTPTLLNRFVYYYPTCRNWYYDYGDYIETLSAYDASAYVGYVKRVYGRVEEVYYSAEDHNYYLYFGQQFPYHDFSVVIPRHIARQISLTPTWYFQNENVWVVGLIDSWDNKPEIVVHDEDQIRRY